MGFIKNALNKAIRKQIKQHFSPAPKRQQTGTHKQDTLIREIREKRKIADDIKANAKIQMQGHLKIVKDCVNLVNTTFNPEVFFMRYNLMLEHLEALVGLECTGIFENSPELPSDAFTRIDAQFDEETNKFLERSFENAKKHADTLKTESGKTNAIKRYFENMEKYTVRMSSESVEYFNKMKEENKI